MKLPLRAFALVTSLISTAAMADATVSATSGGFWSFKATDLYVRHSRPGLGRATR